MSVIAKFKNLSEADKARAVEKLITDSTPDFDFFLFITLSFLMATFGLIIGSAAVVIGSMLIAPILYPILSFSLGLVMADFKLLGRSLSTLGKSLVIGVGAAAAATLFTTPGGEMSGEILARAHPSLLYFAVAVIAGVAVSYALVKQELSETLPGIAVSVALLPPLAVVGIGIALLDEKLILGSSALFGLNVLGIAVASTVSFSLMNLHAKRTVADNTIAKEKERVERENQKAEEIANHDGGGGE